MNSCFVYIVKCRDGTFYTGITSNIERRILEHNSRIKSCLQKSKVPVELVYLESFPNRIGVAKREKEIKGWSRKKKLSLIEKFTLNPAKTDEMRVSYNGITRPCQG